MVEHARSEKREEDEHKRHTDPGQKSDTQDVVPGHPSREAKGPDARSRIRSSVRSQARSCELLVGGLV